MDIPSRAVAAWSAKPGAKSEGESEAPIVDYAHGARKSIIKIITTIKIIY